MSCYLCYVLCAVYLRCRGRVGTRRTVKVSTRSLLIRLSSNILYPRPKVSWLPRTNRSNMMLPSRETQRKMAMYRRSNRMQIAGRVKKMRPKKIGNNHRDKNLNYRRHGCVQKGKGDNYVPLAIHFSSQYPRAKIFCTQIFYSVLSTRGGTNSTPVAPSRVSPSNLQMGKFKTNVESSNRSF